MLHYVPTACYMSIIQQHSQDIYFTGMVHSTKKMKAEAIGYEQPRPDGVIPEHY